jgi:hypothetical protein
LQPPKNGKPDVTHSIIQSHECYKVDIQLSLDAGDLGFVDCLCTRFFRLSTMIISRVSQLTESRNGPADVRFVSRCFDKGEKTASEEAA